MNDNNHEMTAGETYAELIDSAGKGFARCQRNLKNALPPMPDSEKSAIVDAMYQFVMAVIEVRSLGLVPGVPADSFCGSCGSPVQSNGEAATRF